jgi:hypothetical protein
VRSAKAWALLTATHLSRSSYQHATRRQTWGRLFGRSWIRTILDGWKPWPWTTARPTAPARSPPGSRSNGPEGLTRCGRDGLPECWLGKNHALYLGTEAAGGEWLLFTDADVRLSAGCVEDAIRYAAREDLDHLTLTPELISWGGPEELRGGLRPSLRDYAQRPWRSTEPRARGSVGVGSFNLLKREAYLRAGTHRATRLRPDDDMRLVRLLKDAGLSQGVAYGTGSVSVEWHKTLAGAVKGSTRAYS